MPLATCRSSCYLCPCFLKRTCLALASFEHGDVFIILSCRHSRAASHCYNGCVHARTPLLCVVHRVTFALGMPGVRPGAPWGASMRALGMPGVRECAPLGAGMRALGMPGGGIARPWVPACAPLGAACAPWGAFIRALDIPGVRPCAPWGASMRALLMPGVRQCAPLGAGMRAPGCLHPRP